jgi:hypothetical protein
MDRDMLAQLMARQIAFNPGLRQGQNFPNPTPYSNDQLLLPPPPPQAVMPPGWQPIPPEGTQPSFPEMLERLLRMPPGRPPLGRPAPGGPQGNRPLPMPPSNTKGQLV